MLPNCGAKKGNSPSLESHSLPGKYIQGRFLLCKGGPTARARRFLGSKGLLLLLGLGQAPEKC